MRGRHAARPVGASRELVRARPAVPCALRRRWLSRRAGLGRLGELLAALRIARAGAARALRLEAELIESSRRDCVLPAAAPSLAYPKFAQVRFCIQDGQIISYAHFQ